MKYTDLEKREIIKYAERFEFEKYLKKKTILITGARGLVGTGLIKWILLQNEQRGDKTHIIASTRKPDEIPEDIEEGDDIEFCEYGYEDKVSRKIDYIIHAASPTDNRYRLANPVETFQMNVHSTERLLELCRKNMNCSMIYLSSEEVYGWTQDDSPAMTEEMAGAVDSLDLRNCYALGKKAAEFLCYGSAMEYGTDVKIIRLTVIQGLFQRYEETRVVNELLRCIVEKKDFVMKSDGLTKKCMLYSLDAITAILMVLFKGEKGHAYNATNRNLFMTVKDLAESLFQKYNTERKIIFAKDKAVLSDGYLPHRTLLQDDSKLKKLGWEPRGSLDHIYEVDIERFKV